MLHTDPILGGVYTCTDDDYTPFNCEVQVDSFTESDVFYTYLTVTNKARRKDRQVGAKNRVSRETFRDYFVLIKDVEPEELTEKIELTPVSFNDLFH